MHAMPVMMVLVRGLVLVCRGAPVRNPRLEADRLAEHRRRQVREELQETGCAGARRGDVAVFQDVETRVVLAHCGPVTHGFLTL
jgi:hypothetical protein